jgi:hypothetical protein
MISTTSSNNLITVGITLAFMAGFFVGSSVILQKKGILDTKQMALETGNSRAHLKSVTWWLGILCSKFKFYIVALGEVSNFIAYSLSPAIIVAPLMAVSVVVR